MPPAPNLYTVAASYLGKHITLDPSVPADVGCAEAVSFILAKTGVTGIPSTGFAGTADLYAWLAANNQFSPLPSYEIGCVIISPSILQNGVVTVHGHVGIVANYGVLSNDSENGLWSEKLTVGTWLKHYGQVLKLPVYYFKLL